jgi:hypothetical protein
MLHDALEITDGPRSPSAGRRRRPARSTPDEVGSACGPQGAHGRDVCILAVGKMLGAAEAAEALAAEGIEATVWDVRVRQAARPRDARRRRPPPLPWSPSRTAPRRRGRLAIADASWPSSDGSARPAPGAGARRARPSTSPRQARRHPGRARPRRVT